MPAIELARSLFIRESTILPGGLIIETEAILPGWRAVKDHDSYRFGRKIKEANWNFFFLAGELTATVFGRVGPSSMNRALRSILANPAARKFNSLEITSARSTWFLGIPLVTVTANFRHIQQGLALDRGIDFSQHASVAPEGARATNKFETLVSSS